jgi:hypothetical protein
MGPIATVSFHMLRPVFENSLASLERIITFWDDTRGVEPASGHHLTSGLRLSLHGLLLGHDLLPSLLVEALSGGHLRGGHGQDGRQGQEQRQGLLHLLKSFMFDCFGERGPPPAAL